MTDAILVLNSGSSSLKFSLFAYQPELPLLCSGQISDIGGTPVFRLETPQSLARPLAASSTHETALRTIIDWIHEHKTDWKIKAIAHRIVHGGTEFINPVRISSDVFQRLEKLCPLAPLHQPHNLKAVEIVEQLLPRVPQIACFDTAFHAGHDPLFSSYALPQDLRDKGIRRYGFHGLSYEWISHVLKQDYPDLAKGRVIAAHLGNGSSLCAMVNGKSVDTTMGMTALDGVPMGTRCGALDPGAVIYMLHDLNLPADVVENILYEKSGLKGLSGQTNDVKSLLASSDPRARFALEYYALRVAQYIAMMAVSSGGIDGIVFTGGIGENADTIRTAILDRLPFFNHFKVLVIPANEERMMAMHTLQKV